MVKSVSELRAVAELAHTCFQAYLAYHKEVWTDVETYHGGHPHQTEAAYLMASKNFRDALELCSTYDLDTRFAYATESYFLRQAIKTSRMFIDEDPYDDSDMMQACINVTQRDFDILHNKQNLDKAIEVIRYYADDGLYFAGHCEEYPTVDSGERARAFLDQA